ncbi:MAG: hypothetical protein IPG04_26370 [Polyangiaceae bacterium]|nr:hypothetical protein [Polyangiaceae bacterium]
MKGRPLAAITWTVRRPILGKLYFVAVLAALIAVELTVERRTKNLGLAVGATLATLLLLSLLFGLYVKLAGRRVTVTDAGLSVGREMLPYGRVEAILYTPADIAQANGYQILRIRHATGTLALTARGVWATDIEDALSRVERENPSAVVGPDPHAQLDNDAEVQV